jgi:hypothetical protein
MGRLVSTSFSPVRFLIQSKEQNFILKAKVCTLFIDMEDGGSEDVAPMTKRLSKLSARFIPPVNFSVVKRSGLDCFDQFIGTPEAWMDEVTRITSSIAFRAVGSKILTIKPSGQSCDRIQNNAR